VRAIIAFEKLRGVNQKPCEGYDSLDIHILDSKRTKGKEAIVKSYSKEVF